MHRWLSEQGSTTTKLLVGLAMGVVIGGGATLAALGLELNSTADQLASTTELSAKISDTHYPPMPPCTPPPDGPNNCLTPEQYQQYLQNQPLPNQTAPPPNNQTQPPASGQTAPAFSPQPSYDSQNPANNPANYQNLNPNQQPPTSASGQPVQPNNQFQNFQPFNAASPNIGPPPSLSFQQPAGLQDPDKCFREKGGEALVSAVRSGKMTPGLMSQAASCFVGNFNNAAASGEQGRPGSGAPGSGNDPAGQGTKPFGQVSIFSGSFINIMAAVKPPANDCVVRVAGEAVASKMFSQGIQPDTAIKNKIFAAGCFGPPPGSRDDGSGVPNGQPGAPGRQFVGPPLEVVDCLNKISGNGDIQSGKRVPSPAEFSAGQACYVKANVVPFFVPPSEVKDDSPLALCAKAVIGVTDISSITPNSLTRDQKLRMRQCYAPAGEQAMANTQPSLSQETADCVKKIMGEAAFAQVSTGKLEPTAEQRKSVSATCFPKKQLSDIARLSSAAVPLPQAHALMADIDPTKVSGPSVVLPTITAVNNDPGAAIIELNGALELGAVDVSSTVDVYVNSEATIITVPTKISDDGKNTWSSKIAFSSLSSEEEHTLYAVVTTADGTVIRSPLVGFVAKARAAPSDGATVPEVASKNSVMTTIYGALGVLVLSGVIFWLIRRKHQVA